MPDVVGIRFRSCGKIYDFEVNGMEVKEGDSVIVDSEFGLGIGIVVKGKRSIESPEQELKKIIRFVTEEDLRAREENKKLEKEAGAFCVERVAARGLPMKFVGAEATLDRKRIIFYFTADGRIDFRELVKDLAAKFRTRIEMRQIGIRDEAKLIGGLGICGRELCCKTFITSFEPISIKMAKKQELVLNVGKLSGLCSRLMCCLKYEYEGELGSIVADDEIPAEEDEAPKDIVEERLSTILSKAEAAEDRPASKPLPSGTRDAEKPTPQQGTAASKEGAADSQKTRKARQRGRRRRFKK